MKRKFLIFLCLVLFIVSVAGVSATEDVNQTINDDVISTSQESDGINDVLSDNAGTLSDLRNEISAGGNISLKKSFYSGSVTSFAESIKIDVPSVIDGNGATIDLDGSGACAFIVRTSNVIIKDITFINAHDSDYFYEDHYFDGGGVIYGFGVTDIKIENCNFIHNSAAANGGAIWLSGKRCTIKNCNFTDNDAIDNGGAIVFSQTSGSFENGTIENCNFIRNSADFNGGALCIYNTTVKNCNFINNTGYGSAGAIYLAPDCNIENCNFTGNTVPGTFYGYNAGAIYASSGSHNITNCNFIDNYANENGGAIYSYSDMLNIKNCNFINNNAKGNGGTIYSGAICMDINNCSFCGENGLIYFDNYHTLYGSPEDYYHGQNLTVLITDSNFEDNENNWRYEGLIYFSENILMVSDYYETKNYETENYENETATGNVSVTIAGKSFIGSFDSNAVVSFNLSRVPSGNWDTKIFYSGDYKFSSFDINIPLTIESNVSYINLDVPDVTKNYGGPEELEITLTESDAPASNATVNIILNGVDYNVTTDSNGNASLPIDLNAGTYDAIVTYQEVSVTANITVNQLTTETTLDYVKNAYDNVTLMATVNSSNTSGEVVFTVNGENYTASLVDSKATYTLDSLSTGNYTANAVYNGDINHKSSASNNVSFIVEKAKENLTLVASTTPISVGQVAIVVVEGFKNATGNASARVGNGIYFASINDGIAVFRIPDLVANDTALISYPGDDNYNNASTSVDIVVYPAPVTPKENLTLVASTTPISVGQVAIVVVEGFKNATGNASARVGNGIYFASIDGGIAVFRIPDLVANDTALISYPGDDNYNEASTSVDIIVNPVNTNITLSFAVNGNNVTLTADVSPSDLAGEVVFNVNGENYTVKIADSKATYVLANLEAGSYVANAFYAGNATYKSCQSKEVSFNISEDYVVITAPDLEKYYRGPERFAVTLTDSKGNPVTNASVSININGNNYTRVTDDKGVASMAINLNSGVYEALTKYNNSEVKSTITIKETVSGENVTKMFRNGTQYYATFYDTKGNTLANNTAVEFNINGVFYTRYTNEKGVARMNINLNPGEYIITAKNPNSTEQYTNIITVLPTIVENYDLTKYYKNASQYSLRLLDEKGNPVKAGVNVKLNINGVFYTRTSNADGYVKMNINLEPGEYTITADYNGLMASNKIKVLSVIETHDLVMKYKDGSKFEAKILDGQGKAYPGQKVTFNINGVFYERITGDDGIASLNINLMAGEYIITSSYNGMNAANKVTISS